MLHVHANVDQAIELIFVENSNDARVDLVLEAIQDTRDLFYFLMDMTLKGVVRLFGQGERRVLLDSISIDQFQVVAKKMRNAGIVCRLDVIPMETSDERTVPRIDMDNRDVPADAPLTAYSARFCVPGHDLVLSFGLGHAWV